MIRHITLIAIFIFVLSMLPSGASAKNVMYRYTDSTGALAFTKDLSEVPVDQRKKAVREGIDIDALPPVNVLTSPPSESVTPEKKSVAAKTDSKTREYWQHRYDKSKSDLDAARVQLQFVQYNMRTNMYSGPGMQQRQADGAKQETELKNAITRLEGEVNGGIADEARRAGAPAEWYRDLHAK